MASARILVADDEPNLRRVLIAILRREGYEVVQAADGADGNLRDKIVIDVSNPLDFGQGMPPTLFTGREDSLGEQIHTYWNSRRYWD